MREGYRYYQNGNNGGHGKDKKEKPEDVPVFIAAV